MYTLFVLGLAALGEGAAPGGGAPLHGMTAHSGAMAPGGGAAYAGETAQGDGAPPAGRTASDGGTASGGSPPAVEPDAVSPARVQYANWRELKLPCRFQSKGAAPVAGLRLWWTRDGGNSWQVLPPTGTVEPQPFMAFSASEDGSYGFLLQALDTVGNMSPAPVPGDAPPMTVVVDTRAPVIEVLSPGADQRGFQAGQAIQVQWAVNDDNLCPAPLEIHYLRKGEEIPVPLRRDVAGFAARDAFSWPLPLTEGDITLLFRARDLAGNRAEERVGPFRIEPFQSDNLPGAVVADTRSRTRVVPVFFRFDTFDLAQASAVELYWFAGDARTTPVAWRLGAVNEDGASPIMFRAPRDGLFGLFVAVKGTAETDGGPAAYLRPLPERFDADVMVLVDTHDPQVEVRLVNGTSSGHVWLQAGQPAEIEFVVSEENPAPGAVAIDYSLDGETWHVLADGLSSEPGMRCVYTWNVPYISSAQLRLKVRATDRVGRSGAGEFQGTLAIRDPGSLGKFEAKKLVGRARLRLHEASGEGLGEAIELLHTAVGFSPDDAEAHFLLGGALSATGDRQGALTHLRRAVTLHPKEVSYRLDLAHLLLAVAREAPSENTLAEVRAHLEHVELDEMFLRNDFLVLKQKLEAAESALARLALALGERLEGER